MYRYLKNIHIETISRTNLYELSQKEVQRNFAKLKSLSSLFRISRNKKSYFATTLAGGHREPAGWPARDHIPDPRGGHRPQGGFPPKLISTFDEISGRNYRN
jgi:hypothetical protein